ncbi:MAG: hypothetical protein H7Y11_02805, partial [Armatimonadetes bacterium]|nr:hypothetical protein [Anaerolineae bacterium]
VAYDDDSAAGLAGYAPTDAALIALTLPPGEYSVRVNSFNGVTVGEVELLLTLDAALDTQTPSVDTLTVTLYADEVYGVPLMLESIAGLSITVRDPLGVLDPLVTLRDAEGRVVAANDDHNTLDLTLNIFDARISPAEVLPPGAYTLEIREFLGRAGAMEVVIREVAAAD